jgi:hypothetical protein
MGELISRLATFLLFLLPRWSFSMALMAMSRRVDGRMLTVEWGCQLKIGDV